MYYEKTIHYQIIPKEAYKVIRNCSGCGCKMQYISTEEFRVNANGNKVDVWLIYQCKKCKHTYNLSIYERVKPSEIKSEYERFLANDKELALQYGMNKVLFIKNKAEIDFTGILYKLENLKIEKIATDNVKLDDIDTRECIQINNPYGIKIRTDKIVSEILEIAREKVKQLEKRGIIQIEKRYLGNTTNIMIKRHCT